MLRLVPSVFFDFIHNSQRYQEESEDKSLDLNQTKEQRNSTKYNQNLPTTDYYLILEAVLSSLLFLPLHTVFVCSFPPSSSSL